MRRAARRCAVLAPIALLLLARPALGDTPSVRDLLASAQEAADELRVEDAAALLDRALGSGACGPTELVALYRLSGQLAVTVGDDDRGERDFVRLLALDPRADLPDGTSPKIQVRFDAARALIAERGSLAVDIDGGAAQVMTTVRSDPAGMIAGVRAAWRDEDRRPRRTEVDLGHDREVAIEIDVDAPTELDVTVVDARGNVLVERRVSVSAARREEEPESTPARAAPSASEATVVARSERREAGAPPPLYARWPVWAGVAAGFAFAGVVFALRSQSAQNELDELNQSSSSHDFHEAVEVEDRLRRDSVLANVGFALAAGAGITALAIGVHGEF